MAFDDIIIAPYTDGSNGQYAIAILAQEVVFGAECQLQPGHSTAYFQINGIDANDGSAGSVSSAGDVTGDGFDDLIIARPLRRYLSCVWQSRRIQC